MLAKEEAVAALCAAGQYQTSARLYAANDTKTAAAAYMAAEHGPYTVDVLVAGHRLPKHRNKCGQYVLSTPETTYEIRLESLSGAPVVVEVFVDGHSALCPPRRTRLLRNEMRVRGFEKRRVDLESIEGTIKWSFEYNLFKFAIPSDSSGEGKLDDALAAPETPQRKSMDIQPCSVCGTMRSRPTAKFCDERGTAYGSVEAAERSRPQSPRKEVVIEGFSCEHGRQY
jgi:hypothetical protein